MRKRDLVLGIDVGGTNTGFGFVDREGAIFNATSMPTQADDSAQAFVSRLHQRVEEIRGSLSFPHCLCGIGIGAPNAHHHRGTIEKAVNLNWGDTVDFVSLIRNYYDLPVSITNDANAAAAGEMLFGAARGMKHFIVITLGTGVGSGIVSDGRLIYGASGFAGELGHTVVDPEGRPCGCGKRGCLESYASAAGIRKTAFELLASLSDPSPLRAMSFEDLTSKQLYELARSGDVIAQQAFDRTAKILGMKLADAVAHTSPEAIFLAGGLAGAGDLLIKPAELYMNDFLFRVFQGTVKLMPSGLETGTSAILGAAAFIWSEL